MTIMPFDLLQTFTGAHRDSVVMGFPLGNGYRWFLPSLMRFNAADALSPFSVGGLNLYAYCDNDPINRADPSGHMNIEFGEVEEVQRIAPGATDSAQRGAAASRSETDRPIVALEAENNLEPRADGPNDAHTPGSSSGARPRTPPPGAAVRPWVRRPVSGTAAEGNWRRPANRTAPEGNWRRPATGPAAALPGDDRVGRIQAATSLLADPPAFDLGPIFSAVPSQDWQRRGYRQTLTIGWTLNRDEGEMRVLAHVHYAWENDAWRKFAGNAWISGTANWQHRTTPAVLAMAPDIPPDAESRPA